MTHDARPRVRSSALSHLIADHEVELGQGEAALVVAQRPVLPLPRDGHRHVHAKRGHAHTRILTGSHAGRASRSASGEWMALARDVDVSQLQGEAGR